MSVNSGVLAPITPVSFVQKWKQAALNERQAAQEHFLDLCALMGHPTPSESDPSGSSFTFEKGAAKVGGGRGFADVWKKDHFAWEYKRRKSNLDDALLQLMRYAPALGSPPLQIVCDIDRLRIHTAWTNTVPMTYEIGLDDLVDAEPRRLLRHVFFEPEKLKPTRTRAAVTAEAADKFSRIAERLQGRGTGDEIAHFVNQLVFCFFAQSVGLLSKDLMSRLLTRARQKPDGAKEYFDKLFQAMERGGEFDLTEVAWFNGGLFDRRRAMSLEEDDIALLTDAAGLDWSMIDPTIFGTLFERFLDPEKRAQIGAHYTDSDKIMRLVDPVILRPLRAEWAATKQTIVDLLDGRTKPPMRKAIRRRMTAIEAAEEERSAFGERLHAMRILDPACGSGNFLYLALQGVKDIENRANLECEMLGLHPRLDLVGPEILRGIEINPMAAELARTTIWIGDIQWQLRNGIPTTSIPILRTLDTIENGDALVREGFESSVHQSDKAEQSLLKVISGEPQFISTAWPEAEFVVGNPPFLGGKKLREKLGHQAVERLFAVYEGEVSQEADLVCYWFHKALDAVENGRSSRVGFVATNSIRGGANRKVLEGIISRSRIFEAWSNEPWVIDGASVRVSLVCFGRGNDELRLDENTVSVINPDLTAGIIDLTRARRLAENLDVAFMGDTKGGAFDVPGEVARAWLREPLNPNGRPNADVLRPWRNGADVIRRARDMWIIDFGFEMSEADAALYQGPFEYAREHVLPERAKNTRDAYREKWWRHVEPRPAMLARVSSLDRYIVTARVAKHRIFSWMRPITLPDSQVIVVTRQEDAVFGILHSRFHQEWSLRLGTSLEDRPRYTPTTTFETFPFPEGLTPDIPAERYQRDPRAITIAAAARRLDDLRNAWLNPADLVVTEPEVVPGYPDRILPRDIAAAETLRERTLTNLYNQRPRWLSDTHRDLDAAVAAAYGWPSVISNDEALAKLLDLNLSRRPAAEAGGRKSAGKSRRKTIAELHAQPELLMPIAGGKQTTSEETLGGKTSCNDDRAVNAPAQTENAFRNIQKKGVS